MSRLLLAAAFVVVRDPIFASPYCWLLRERIFWMAGSRAGNTPRRNLAR
jgi:hypothetical protein